MIRTETIWEGPGWYVTRLAGSGDDKRKEVFLLPWASSLAPTAWRQAQRLARVGGFNKPSWRVSMAAA